MKNILVIFLLLSITIPSFAQQESSYTDSLVFARINCIGPWLGTYYINHNGLRDNDPDAPQWPVELLIDSFAEKSLNPKEVFDFIKANIKILHKRFSDHDLYFISVTNKAIIWIRVKEGKPEIFRTEMPNKPMYYDPATYYIKRIPEKHNKVKGWNK